jgi:hypothetical protein
MKKAEPKKLRKPKAGKLTDDLTSLPDAVVDGKLRVKLKGGVVFERTLNGRTKIHTGYVAGIRGSVVEIWDETQDQFWVVELSSPPPILKARSLADLEGA